ncbi:NUDIX hydrolase [Ferroacidibacillus organovorans]|nr:NUDIX hydrolase [Ferroacidibacillus organovorans]
MSEFHETLLRTERVFQGRMIALDQDLVRLPNGRESTREVVRHPGAVCILLQDGLGRLCLVRQYRHPVGKELYELPAGKLDRGEDPQSAAARELYEETGRLATVIRHALTFFTTPGFTDEVMHLYVAECDDTREKTGELHLDDDEFLAVTYHTRNEVQAMLARGALVDAKTLIGVLLWLGGNMDLVSSGA